VRRIPDFIDIPLRSAPTDDIDASWSATIESARLAASRLRAIRDISPVQK
jgi:hypothetical protein